MVLASIIEGLAPNERYKTPPMPFGITIDEIPSFVRSVRGMQVIKVAAYPEPYPKKMPILALLSRIPSLRARAPALVHAAFGSRHVS